MLFRVTRVSEWDRLHNDASYVEPRPCPGAECQGSADGWVIEIADLDALIALIGSLRAPEGHLLDVVLTTAHDGPDLPNLWIVDTPGGAVPSGATAGATDAANNGGTRRHSADEK